MSKSVTYAIAASAVLGLFMASAMPQASEQLKWSVRQPGSVNILLTSTKCN